MFGIAWAVFAGELSWERAWWLGLAAIHYENPGHNTGSKDDHGGQDGFPSVHHVSSKSSNEASITDSKSVASG